MYSRVYIEITNVCNMNCSFCHRHSRKYDFMSFDSFVHVLNALRGKTEYIYFHLMGEPLLHPELSKFTEEAVYKGFKPMLTTNGTLLGKCETELLNLNIHKINISVHSFEQNDSNLQISYLNNVASFAKNASSKGIITVLRLWNEGVDDGKNNITISYLKSFFDSEWKENSRGYRIKDKLFLEFGERFEWPDVKADIRGNSYFCHGLRDHFGILVDGTVVPCCLDSDGVIALGNVFDNNLDDILESNRARMIYDGFSCGKAAEDLCRKCGYAQRFV